MHPEENHSSEATDRPMEEPTPTSQHIDDQSFADFEIPQEILAADAAAQEIEVLKDKQLRLMAEFDNYRRRTLKENAELRQTAGKDVLAAFLSVIDDFDRAEGLGEVTSEGLKLVHQKMHSLIKAKGVTVMESTGLDFDASRHEAVTEIPMPGMQGKVIDTIEKGYLLNGAILRYAKVIVGA